MRKTKLKRKRHARASKSGQNKAIVAVPTVAEAIEKVLIQGDLSPLSPEQRVAYYNACCKSLGLNPLTSPFTYIAFKEYDNDSGSGQAKLQLYANKSCTEQLRKIHGVSVIQSQKEITDDYAIYEVQVQDRTLRMDSAVGIVPLFKFTREGKKPLGMRERANAIMKAHTKAKRRATLSICGLAFLDESELDTMRVVGGVSPEGRVYEIAQENGSHEKAQAVLRGKIEEASQSSNPKVQDLAREALRTMPPRKVLTEAEQAEIWPKREPKEE
jgi:hypothetical protein